MSFWNRLFKRNKVEVIKQDAIPEDMALVHRDALFNPVSNPMQLLQKSQAGEPMAPRKFSVTQLDWIYEQMGYARKICDQKPKDGTRKGWTVKHDKADALMAQDKALNSASKLCEAGKLANRYGGAYVLMVLDEEPNFSDDDGERVNLSLPPSRPKSIVNLVVFDPDECTPEQWEGNPRSPEYREGKIYQITPKVNDLDNVVAGMRVHRSRLLYFGGVGLSARRRYENNGIDRSMIEASWDGLRYLDDADQSLSEFIHENKIGILKKAGWSAVATGDDAKAAEDDVQQELRRKSASNTMVMDANDDYLMAGNPATGLGEGHDRLKERLATDSDQPMTLLYGQTPSGLNTDGESQASTWREQVASWQQDELLPRLMKYYRLLCACLGVDVGDLEVVFNPLDEPTEKDKAETDKAKVEVQQLRLALLVSVIESIRNNNIDMQGGVKVIAQAFDVDDTDAQRLIQAASQPSGVNPVNDDGTNKMTA